MFSIGSFSLGTLFGILITSIVQHFLAKNRSKQERLDSIFNQAAHDFRESFSDELSFLNQKSENNNLGMDETAYHVLKEAFAKHEKAKNIFQYHLPDVDRDNFENTWQEYCFPELEESQSPGPLIDYASEGDEKERRQLAISKIEKLLRFAQPK